MYYFEERQAVMAEILRGNKMFMQVNKVFHTEEQSVQCRVTMCFTPRNTLFQAFETLWNYSQTKYSPLSYYRISLFKE